MSDRFTEYQHPGRRDKDDHAQIGGEHSEAPDSTEPRAPCPEGRHIHIHNKTYIRAEAGSTQHFIGADVNLGTCDLDKLIRALKAAANSSSE